MDLKKNKGLIYTGSFIEGVCPILYVSQVLGIFPLKGIQPKPSSNVHFSWLSIASLICLEFMIWDAVVLLTHFFYTRNSNISADIISGYAFFFVSFCIYGVFLRLATRWVSITKWWTDKEQRFLQAPYVTKSSKNLKNKLLTVAIVIAILAIVEHALFTTSGIYTYIRQYKQCNITNAGIHDFLYKRFANVHVYIPGLLPLILTQFASWFGTAAWNFLDLFIIVICIGITTRFNQLTSALKHHLQHEIPTPKSMLRFRLDFIAVCELLEYVDKHMGLIVFLSALNNIFFVCSQLLHAFNVLRYFIDYLYYWFSLSYLILRTLYLFLSAAAINESARSPVRLLHNISYQHWNDECDRLLFQINSSTIALSAMGFFNFTRELILTMAGTIVTFELVMLQFGNTVNSLQPLCAS